MDKKKKKFFFFSTGGGLFENFYHRIIPPKSVDFVRVDGSRSLYLQRSTTRNNEVDRVVDIAEVFGNLSCSEFFPYGRLSRRGTSVEKKKNFFFFLSISKSGLDRPPPPPPSPPYPPP